MTAQISASPHDDPAPQETASSTPRSKRETDLLVDSLTPRMEPEGTRTGRRARGRPSAWLTGDFHVDEKDTLPEFPWKPSLPNPASLKLPVEEPSSVRGYRPSAGERSGGGMKRKRESRDEYGPGTEGVGVRVAIFWPEERRTYAGTVARYDPRREEYLVEYEDDDSQAWHPWSDIRNILPERSPRLGPVQPHRQHQKALSALDMLADTIRDHVSNSSEESGGLLALSEVAQGAQEPVSLKVYAREVEKEVSHQLQGLCREEISPGVFGDAIEEIKGIVMQAIDTTKEALGAGTVITTMTLG